MSFHTEVEGFKSEVEKERAHCGHRDTHIADELNSCLGDIRNVVSELLYVSYAVVGGIGIVELGPLFGICRPIELTAVYYASANDRCVTVHILGGGMNYDIASVLKSIDTQKYELEDIIKLALAKFMKK